MSEREPWDIYFMKLAEQAASRSTCTRRRVGAVAVNESNRIIGSGYNGAPSGLEHCTRDTCIRQKMGIPSGQQLDLCKAIHAEANIVLQLGSALSNAILYCTTQPCTSCLKLLMGVGIRRIVWKEFYPDAYSTELMLEYGIPFIRNGYTSLIRGHDSVTCGMFTAQEFMDFYQISCDSGLIFNDLFKLVIYEKSKTGRVADFINLLENKPTTDFFTKRWLKIS